MQSPVMRNLLIFFASVILIISAQPRNVWAQTLSLDFVTAARLAVSSSDQLRNEARYIQLRQGAWAWGLRAYLPRLSIIVSEDDRLSQINSDSFIKNYSVSIDQLLWDGGRLSATRKIEKADLDDALHNLERMSREIGETALSAYRNVLFHRMTLDIREKTYKYLEEQRRIMQVEFRLGMVLPLDLAAADITIAEADVEIRLLKIDLIEAEQKLTELLGLDELPLLTEEIDIFRSTQLPNPDMARAAAESANPALVAVKNLVNRRQIEAKYAALSWLPVIRLTGNVSLSGTQYPLTRYNWSVGITFEFSSPWISGSISGSTGREGLYDKNARMQSTAMPVPDPASSFSSKAAALNLKQEELNYANILKLTGRMAEQAVEKCLLLDQKRLLAIEIMQLEAERYRLAQLKLELGRLTRIDLMDAMLVYAERQIAAVRAAAALLEAERELEQFLDLPPGGLAQFSFE